MPQVRPMLDDTELQQVQSIDVDGDQVLLRHSIPGLEGDFLQRLNRRASRIRLSGVLTGATARDDLKTLRDKYRAGDPVSFVADISTATRVGEVLIQALNIRELAGKPERFEYGFLLREYQPPPPPPTPVTPVPPGPPTIPITQQVGNLIIEVVVEGRPNYDFSRVTVNVQGTQQDGTNLPRRTLSNRSDNIWTENDFPAGSYTAEAVAAEDGMSNAEAAEVRPGETEQVTIILRPGTTVAHAFIVHFTFDRAFIEPCLMRVLKRVADYAQSHGDEKLVIVGHTDEVGSQGYNISLGDRRARTAYAALTYGAVPDAAVDEWNEIRRPRPAGETPSIHEGRGGWGIVEYQYILQDLGFYPGNVDGQTGPLTESAIRNFQQAQGLSVDGDVGDQTWPVLIRAYLDHYNLNLPSTQFLPNCEGEILKWLSCGELMPLPTTPRPCSSPAWRPNRRTELLFTTADTLPCPVPQPVTFDLPPPDGIGGGWCIGPGNPNEPCCFITYETNQPNKWLIQPAEAGTLSIDGRIRFEDGSPAANIPYVLTAPDGEYLHIDANGQPNDGEIICGANNKGTPNPIHNRTDANGAFNYPRQTPVGVYTLEIKAAYVARLEGQPLEDARGNIVCKHLQPGNPFDVVIVDLAVASVRPNISATRSLVIVQKPHTNPARVTITLHTNSAFSGSGILTRSDNRIRFFSAPTGGSEITFDGADNVFTSAQLSAGHDVYAEGARHSDTMDDVVLTLALTVNGQPGFTDRLNMTAVELTLDIGGERIAPGVDPAPLPQPPATPPAAGTTPTDKWYGGRFIHIQNPPNNNHGRALVVVHQVRPAAFAGTLVLRQVAVAGNNVMGPDNKVQVFESENPVAGEVIRATPYEFNAPAADLNFWVQGNNVSASLRDTGFQLGIRGLEDDGDRVRMTVVQFTRVQATINPTPANTPANSAAAGVAAPTSHVFSNTNFSTNFTVNEPLVLMRNAQPSINLEVTCTPNDIPVRWQAIRNSNDHPSLGGAADLPTVTPNTINARLSQLNANQRGSFRIYAYIDTNGTNSFDAGEPYIPLNLVLANATIIADNSTAHPANLSSSFIGGGHFRVANGTWIAGLPGAGMAMGLVADVTGGGNDGRLGLDRVFSGLVNMVQVRDVVGSYRDTTVAPPTNHQLRFLAASNTAAATGNFGGRPLFLPADPAPALYILPLLDSGRLNAGLGADTATMTRSTPHTAVNRPVGERWTIQCIDSPGMTYVRNHPANANAVLRQVHYRYQFTACFCFWTNINRTRTRNNLPAERTYSVLRIVDWEIAGDWNINYPPAPAPPASVVTTPHNIRVANRASVTPIGRAQDHNVEVRPPSGIQIAAWDAH